MAFIFARHFYRRKGSDFDSGLKRREPPRILLPFGSSQKTVAEGSKARIYFIHPI
jgi:hypothetical protein